jgi:hypothetical protein
MKFLFEPYDRVTVRNYMQYNSPADFADAITLSMLRGGGGRFGNLLWAHGVLFRHSPYSPTDTMSKEYLDGHLLLDNLEFTPMRQYQRELRHEEFMISILNVSNNYVLSRLAEWVANTLIGRNSKKKK